jgi:hypothetical protein
MSLEGESSRRVSDRLRSSPSTVIMAVSHLEAYFASRLEELSLKPHQSAEAAVMQAEETVTSLLSLPMTSQERLTIPQPSKCLTDLISSTSYKQSKVEDTIRQQRLKETVHRKKELQEKLEFLDSQIEILEEVPSSNAKDPEVSGLSEEDRLAFIKKIEQHKEMRDRARQAKIAKMQSKLEKLETDKRLHREAEQAELHRAKLAQHQEAEKELRRREQQRLILKSERDQAFKAVLKSKPRFVQIEERYEEQVVLPQLEEKKQRLAEIRSHFAPMRHEDMQEHTKQYEEMKRTVMELSQHKATQLVSGQDTARQYYRGKCGEVVEQEERELKEALKREKQERRKVIERRTLYGVKATEIYKPDIDSKLSAYVKQNQLTIKNPRVTTSSPRNLSPGKTYDVKDIDFKTNLTPRMKFKPNPMVPKPKERKSSVHVDFLAEQRKRRDQMVLGDTHKSFDKISWGEGQVLDSSRDLDELMGKADQQLKRAKRHELILSSLLPTSMKNLEAQEAVDDAIVDSLKAKLVVLNSI